MGQGLMREAWLVVTDPTPGPPQPVGAPGKGSFARAVDPVELQGAAEGRLQRDGWTKARFQVQAALPSAISSPSCRKR